MDEKVIQEAREILKDRNYQAAMEIENVLKKLNPTLTEMFGILEAVKEGLKYQTEKGFEKAKE